MYSLKLFDGVLLYKYSVRSSARSTSLNLLLIWQVTMHDVVHIYVIIEGFPRVLIGEEKEMHGLLDQTVRIQMFKYIWRIDIVLSII